MPVAAAETGVVNCTVSGQLVSVTVSDGIVNYGVLALGASKDTLASNLNDKQTATNTGTVTETFNISSSNADGATQDWTLADFSGENQFAHQYSVDNGGEWIPLTAGYQQLADSKTAESSTTFDLRLIMPTSTTDYGTHTITITVQAVQSQGL